MAKKTQRRPARYERDQLGCMWGFISMFNFRNGRSPQKFLIDRRHNSKRTSGAGFLRNKLAKSHCSAENYHETPDGEDRKAGKDFVKPSVKKLIEDELFTEVASKKEIHKEKVENLSDSGHEVLPRTSRKRKSQTRNKSCSNINDISAVDQNTKHRSTGSLDIDNMVEEFYHSIHEKSVSSVNDAYKERLSELIKFLISQKLIHGNGPVEGSEIQTSKDLMEVFQILGCDEELFLKLLRDPDSLLSKDVQETQTAPMEKEENSELAKGPNFPKQRSFFRRKTKPQQKATDKETNASPASERIVILKPGPASLSSPETGNKEPSERVSSHFFLTEVKRKLKHAMGKEHRGVQGDGTSEAFSQGRRSPRSADRPNKESFGRSVLTKDHFFIEKMARPSTRVENENGNSKEKLSNIYIEAKKHLFEMLNNGEEGKDLSRKQVQRTLGKILSLPEYLSPLGSPGRLQQSSLGLHRRSVSEELQKFNEIKQLHKPETLGQTAENGEAQPCITDNVSDDTLELIPSVLSLDDRHVNKVDETSTIDQMSSEGLIETAKEIGITVQEETESLDASSEQCSSLFARSNESNDTPNLTDETKHCEVLIEDSFEGIQLPVSPARSPPKFPVARSQSQVAPSDTPARSSPVSVLEPFFTEDDISPARIKSHSVEPQLQPLCIQFEERDFAAENQRDLNKTSTDDKKSIFEYAKMVLESSDQTCEEFFLKSLSSDQLLQPTLLESVQFIPNQLCPDPELLLDCINEVLLELCGNPPWTAFANPKIWLESDMNTTILEVQERVYWNILPLPVPRTLDQIVRKDFSKSGNWMDLRFDTDCIGTDAGEIILDELLEDIVANCLNACPEIECFIETEC